MLNIGTGSEQVRIGATMQLLLRQFWTGKVMPLMGDLAEQLTNQLVPYYGGTEVYRLAPDFTRAPVMAQYESERKQTQLDVAVTGYHSGLLGYAEARESLGLSPEKPADALQEPFGGVSASVLSRPER